MKTRELAPKAAVTIQGDAAISEAAVLMDASNVGCLLVMDGDRLAGIVTDRDIVVRGVARRVPADARIDSVMTTDVVSVDADADVHEAYRILDSHAVRRLPVVEGNRVVGMVTVDDLLVGLAGDLQRLVHPIVGEAVFGHHPAPVPALR
jgi:CBS domain-containing protein